MNDKPFQIKLLGTPAMSWQGTTVSLQRRQARALLYRVAASEQPVARDGLLFLLWPDAADSSARRNSTRLLSLLRQNLPDPTLLQTTRTTVMLNPDLVWSDVVAFEQMTQSDDVTQWETAVALYRGSFLSGFSLSNSLEFDAWQSQQQYKYERHYLAVLNKLIVAKRQAGQLTSAIDYAQRYLAADDLSEENQRHLIELYAQTGDRSAALRQFEQCVLVLERELGVQPLPETRAAYEAARDNQQHPTPQKAPEPEWATLLSLDLPLIGRETAWRTLTNAYGRFRNGGVIFIAGEPGVGKSRVMQEFATGYSGLVLSGNNHATETAIPYQPLIQALRQALSLRSRWQHALPIWLAELSRLLPELPAHFPDLPPPVEVEPQQAQARLFEALRQVFVSLATDAPLLLCLDDVHWADGSTRGWLQYVSQQLVETDICILATYRTHERATIQTWQSALQRTKLMTIVSLAGLTETAVVAMLDQVQNGPQDPQALATRIHAATGGNTFFVLETIRELIETGQLAAAPVALPLPATIREAVLGRVEHLGPLTQQILEITAVLSPTATFASISTAAGRDEMETANSLEELTGRQLLRHNNDLFNFHHALAREAIYQNITPWRQRLLHRRAANTLITLPQKEKIELAVIAAHFEAADDLKQAIDYYQQAAVAATAVFAAQEAIQHLKRALELATKGKEETAVLPALYESIADNLNISGDFAAAEAAYHMALTLIPDADPLVLAELERKLATTLPPQQRAQEAETLYRSALSRLDLSTKTAVSRQWRATQLNILLALQDAFYFQEKPELMAELRGDIQALLDEVGTAAQQASYFSRLGQIASLKNRFYVQDEDIVLARSALTIAQESDNPRLIARQQFHLGFLLLWYGDLDDIEELFKQVLTVTAASGDYWLQNQCLVYLTIFYRFQGHTRQVEIHLPQLIEISRQVGNNMYIGVGQATIAWLHYHAEAWLPAQNQAQAAIATWDTIFYPFQWLAHWLLLALALQQDRFQDAVAAARAMLHPTQQRLPDKIDSLLTTAVAAHEANDEVTARDYLETAVTRATQHGYL